MDGEVVVDTVAVEDFSRSWEDRRQNRSRWKRILADTLPVHLLRPLGFELRMLALRARSRRTYRQYAQQTDLLVNIGAGDRGKPGWVNLDGYAATNVNCRFDARRRLPFADGAVRGIFSEHSFEHLDYVEEVPGFLRECFRVLKPTGVMRIIVPDAEKYLRAYARGGWDELAVIRPLYDDRRDHYFHFRYNTPMELVNVVFRQWQEHKFAYDFETLAFVLQRAGFKVIRQEYARSVDPTLCIDFDQRASESLYVDAIKPG
jgi:predicted SAM-dependent methyltransferase